MRYLAGCLILALTAGVARAADPVPVASNDPAVTVGRPLAAVSLGAPTSRPLVARGQAPDPTYPSQTYPPPTYPSAPAPSFPDQPFTPAPTYPPPTYPGPPPVPPPTYSSVPPTAPPPNGFKGWCDQVGGDINKMLACPGKRLFESDHAFDVFSSPVTNPFLFEDPRALTEIRPLVMYQTIPSSNPVYQGGNITFYGTQARLALTDRWSFVLNKLGGVSVNPDASTGLSDESGFAELWLGPKWTFVRNPQTCTLAALGVTFQIPTGPSKVAQDTGELSVTPYLSFAQNFGKSSYGSFNIMDTLGFAFGVTDARSDYFYNSFHLDFDVGNRHRFYPFVELNWFHYTSSGTARTVGFEGRDIANLGSTGVGGNDYVTIAVGTRYKFTERTMLGVGTEFPLTSPEDLQDFRLTVDLIFRF